MHKLARVAEILRSGSSLAVAESCSGGLLSAELTSRPGASAWFLGAVVAYDNRLKIDLLGVPCELLEQEGAVSSACALHMARGVRRLLGARLGLGVTGVAGPGGGSPEKPVGLTFMAVTDGRREEFARCLFSGDREEVRRATVIRAISLLVEFLEAGH